MFLCLLCACVWPEASGSEWMILAFQVDLTHLESEVEKRKHAIEEAKARAKGLLPPGSAPGLDSATAGFSPAPKPGECPQFTPHKGIAVCDLTGLGV